MTTSQHVHVYMQLYFSACSEARTSNVPFKISQVWCGNVPLPIIGFQRGNTNKVISTFLYLIYSLYVECYRDVSNGGKAEDIKSQIFAVILPVFTES